MSASSSTGPGGKVACRRESTSTSIFNLWYNHASLSAVMRPRIGHSTVVRQKPGSPSPQLKGPHQSVGVHGGDEQKSVKRGGNGRKWVKIQKCHIPNVEEASKPTLGATMMPPSITKYGSPVRLDAQIVALRPHCARTALKAPPLKPTGLQTREHDKRHCKSKNKAHMQIGDVLAPRNWHSCL